MTDRCDPLPARRPAVHEPPRRRPWSPPELTRLPRLTALTLQTGDAIGGSGDTGSGSTVF